MIQVPYAVEITVDSSILNSTLCITENPTQYTSCVRDKS